MSSADSRFFAYKIREGQEVNVALFIDEVIHAYERMQNRTEEQEEVIKSKPKSLIVIPSMKGVILAETKNPRILEYVLSGQRHYRGRIFGTVKFEEIEPFIRPKSVIEVLNVGDEIEVVSGPLRGSRGKVLRIDKTKNEVTFQPAEVSIPMPMTISMDAVKIVSSVKEVNAKNG
jgi:transcriptional antiterminator NusG